MPLGAEHSFKESGTTQLTASVVWDDRTGTLLHVDVPDSNGRSGDEVQLRLSMLSKYPRTKLSNRLQDSGVYACHRSILEILPKKTSFSSFRREFVPWLCKINYQGRSKLRVGIVTHKLENGFAGRANNLHSYSDLNRRVCRISTFRDEYFDQFFSSLNNRTTMLREAPLKRWQKPCLRQIMF